MVGPLTTFLAGLGLALGQTPPAPPPAPPPAVAVAPADADCMPAPEPVADERSRFYFDGEYLFWWVRDRATPLLVTTGSANDQPPGAIGQPGTHILFGGRGLFADDRSGARLTGGLFLNEERTLAIEGSYFFLGTQAQGPVFGPTEKIILTRPFFNTETNSRDAQLVAEPGALNGKVAIRANLRLEGAEVNATRVLAGGGDWSLAAVGGFRYFHMDDSIDVNTTFQVEPNFFVFPGNRVQVVDNFRTRNDFYGGQIGVRGEGCYGRLAVGFSAKVAIGDSLETLQIRGTTSTKAPGDMAPNVQTGGLYALPSNIGAYHHDNFAVVSEVGVKLGYFLTPRLQGYVGYNYLYDSAVLRAGDHIDPRINPTQAPINAITMGVLSGEPRPGPPPFRESFFWAQGFTAGFEWNY